MCVQNQSIYGKVIGEENIQPLLLVPYGALFNCYLKTMLSKLVERKQKSLSINGFILYPYATLKQLTLVNTNSPSR